MTMPCRVLLVGPSPPPYGGMALQAQQLLKFLSSDGIDATLVPSNLLFPRSLRLIEKIPVLRTALRALLIWPTLMRQVVTADVVHVLAASWWYFFLVVYPAVLVGRAYRRRVILNYRGGQAKAFFRLFGWAVAPAFRLAHVITVPSEYLAEIIRDQFYLSVAVVPNILDNRLFQFRPRTAIQPKILVTRHFEPAYDVESALRAFQEVQESYPQASLWLAGTGTQESRLRGLVKEWNLKHVRFLGAVAHHDLPAVYDQCDIYLNASLIDNFPGALIEASAAGLVVVSTAAGGIPHIYQHGNTGFLVKPSDWRGLATAVRNVLQSPALGAEMALRAAALARSCDWKEVRKSLYPAYGFPAEALSEIEAGDAGIPAGRVSQSELVKG